MFCTQIHVLKTDRSHANPVHKTTRLSSCILSTNQLRTNSSAGMPLFAIQRRAWICGPAAHSRCPRSANRHSTQANGDRARSLCLSWTRQRRPRTERCSGTPNRRTPLPDRRGDSHHPICTCLQQVLPQQHLRPYSRHPVNDPQLTQLSTALCFGKLKSAANQFEQPISLPDLQDSQ